MSWLTRSYPGSIQARLLLMMLGGLGTLMAAMFFALDYRIDREIRDRLDEALEARARGLVALLETHPQQAALREWHEVRPEYALGGHTDFLQLWDATGHTLLSSQNNAGHELARPATPVPANVPLLYDLVLPDGHRGRALALHLEMRPPAGDALLVVAEEREAVDRLVRRVHWSLAVLVLGAALLAALLAALAVRRGLAPLTSFAAAGDDGLDPARLPRELQGFAQRLNRTLGALQEALARERRFARDVAHELRTPLAELRMAVELAADPVATAPLAGNEPLAAIERMQRSVDGLLALARYEAGLDRPNLEPVDVASLLRRALELATPLAAKRGLQLETVGPDECWIMSDPGLVERIIDNLLQNIAAHAPRASVAELRLEAAGAGWWLVLESAAPDLSDADVAHFGERFWRRESGAGTAHGGLGLALAVTLAGVLGLDLAFTLHAGRLQARLGPLRPLAAVETPG